MTTTNACVRCGAPGSAEDRFCGACGTPRTPPPVPPGSGETGEMSAYGSRLLAMVRKATLGEYEIRGEIGRGGMAAVYLAYDLRLNRKVAVKVMLPELALHEGMEDRFRREARTAAKLDHPNIVVIYSVRDDGELLYFVMKFIEGASLEQLVRKHAPLPIPIAQYVLVQLANALQYAHDEGVVHRDVKPANVLIDRRGNALVTDFGIAKATESPTLTRTGSVIGTPAYMSPEQCMGNEQTHASDQYALGVVAYELLAGRPPFVGPSVELQWAHVKTQPPPLLDFRPECPPALANAVMRMLAKDPSERWPSLQDIVPTIAVGLVPGDDSPRAKLAELVRVVAPVPTDGIAVTPASPIPKGRVATPVAPAAPPITLVISPVRTELEVGESTRLTVAIDPASPADTPAPGVTWTTTTPATVSVSADGVVVALAPGSATVTAQARGSSATATITVRQAAVASVRMHPLPRPLEVGASVQLACTIRDSRDREIDDREVDWASSNPRVASVTSTGELTGHAVGKATIGATCESISATTTIEVVPERVTAVIVTPATLTIDERASGKLTVRATDARGKTLAGRQLTFRSANPSVATIAADGTVRAHALGRTAIDATVEGHTGTAEIIVRPAAVASISLTPQAPAITAGDALTFIAALGDATGHALTGRPITWMSSDPNVLSIDAGGRAVGIKAGVAEVVATADGARASARVAVAAAPISRLDIVASESSMKVGKRVRLRAKAQDRTGREVEADGVAWRSSDPTIATVSGDGTVEGVAAGQVTITARASDLDATTTLTVTAAPMRAIPLAVPIGGGVLIAAVAAVLLLRDRSPVAEPPAPNPAPNDTNIVAAPPIRLDTPVAKAPEPVPQPEPPPPPTLATVTGLRVTSRRTVGMERGETSRATVETTMSDGTAGAARGVRWTSANPSIAEVNSSGTITARGEGRTAITATVDTYSTRIDVTVTSPLPARVVASQRALSVKAGETTPLSARVLDRRGASLTYQVVWRSTNPGVATVDNSGTVRGLRAGDGYVLATASGAVDTVRVTVQETVVAGGPTPAPATDPPAPPPRANPTTSAAPSASEMDAALVSAARALGDRMARGDVSPLKATSQFQKFVRDDRPTLVGDPSVQNRSYADGRITGDVSLPLRWKTFTGGQRSASMVLRISLERQGSTWQRTAAENLTNP